MTDKIPVTVIVPVKNEEKNLPHCLNCIKNFGQIFVIDSNSTDKTSHIAQQYNNVEYINFNWDGKYPKKRNWALKNLKIIYDWVLFIDADEYLTNEFIEELKQKIQNNKYNGYWVTYTNYFLGKELKFGDKMRKLPLFKKEFGEYEKINEESWTTLDMEVHEHPIIKGKVGKFKSKIIHNDYKNLEHYISRHNAYSTWEAKRFFALCNNKQSWKLLNKRQKIKYFLLKTGILPLIYFVASYFFKLGFLDGKYGYIFAKYKAIYFFQIQTKILELKTNEKM